MALVIPIMIFISVPEWRKVVNDWQFRFRVIAFALGVSAFWAFNYYDPGRVWDWFFD
jgi:hypothetical protein